LKGGNSCQFHGFSSSGIISSEQRPKDEQDNSVPISYPDIVDQCGGSSGLSHPKAEAGSEFSAGNSYVKKLTQKDAETSSA